MKEQRKGLEYYLDSKFERHITVMQDNKGLKKRDLINLKLEKMKKRLIENEKRK